MLSRLSLAAFVAATLLQVSSFGQAVTVTPDNGGTGADGAFAPVANLTIDTSVQSVFHYTSVTIPSNVTVTVIGSQPLLWKIQGSSLIDGVIDARGRNGGNGGNGVVGGPAAWVAPVASTVAMPVVLSP